MRVHIALTLSNLMGQFSIHIFELCIDLNPAKKTACEIIWSILLY